MNIFKPTTFTWAQLGEFKWALFLVGIAAGATWPRVFGPYALIIFLLGIILSIPPSVAWFREH